jgi:hypothetical protein
MDLAFQEGHVAFMAAMLQTEQAIEGKCQMSGIGHLAFFVY